MVRRLALVFSALAALNVAGCASNPVRDAFQLTGIGAEPKPAPDFVAQSRPETLEYRATGVAPPPRATASKTAADVSKMEAEMDALKAANEARAGAARQAGASASPAAPNNAAKPAGSN